MTSKYPRAVCLLVRRPIDGKILAVSRKTNRTRFGLVGGKVDPGQTPLDALFAEADQEAGIVPLNPKLVYVALCEGEVTYMCSTFMAETFTGELHTEEPIDIEWVNPEVLVDGPFGDYNQGLFETMGIPLRENITHAVNAAE